MLDSTPSISEGQIPANPYRRSVERLILSAVIVGALIWGAISIKGFWNPLVWLTALVIGGLFLFVGIFPLHARGRKRTGDSWFYVSVAVSPRKLRGGWLHINETGITWAPGGIYRRR